MERTPVESSNIKSVGWQPGDGTPMHGALEVEFRSGAVHEYLGVPREFYLEMVDAESVGRYFHKNIRNVYLSRKKEPEDGAAK